jgi:hypothetical protein
LDGGGAARHGDFPRLGFELAEEPIALDGGWIEREDDQGKLAIVRQKLAADDLIAHHATDQGIVSGAFRQLIRKQRRRNRAVFRRLARRENRDDASRAVDQLQVGANGKAAKVALTAIMRKLLVLANALLKNSRTWTTNLA